MDCNLDPLQGQIFVSRSSAHSPGHSASLVCLSLGCKWYKMAQLGRIQCFVLYRMYFFIWRGLQEAESTEHKANNLSAVFSEGKPSCCPFALFCSNCCPCCPRNLVTSLTVTLEGIVILWHIVILNTKSCFGFQLNPNGTVSSSEKLGSTVVFHLCFSSHWGQMFWSFTGLQILVVTFLK